MIGHDEMHERLVEEIIQATQSVLSMMMDLDAKPGTPTLDSAGPGPIGGVLAMISLVGPWAGAGVVGCDEKMACRLAKSLLMCECPEVNDDVLDAMGEVANMVIGTVKNSLESTVGAMSLGIPTVTFGKEFSTRSTLKETWSLVPFQCDGRELFVQILLAESSRLPNSGRSGHPRVLAEV